MKTSNVIRDGYTKEGYIKPEPRIHAGLLFKYRPMLPEHVMALDEQIDQAKAQADGGEALLIADKLAEHLREWSEYDEQQRAVEISTENVRRLPTPLLKQLYYVIAGVIASDVPPADSNGANTPDRVKTIRDQLKTTPGQTELVEQQGN